MTALVCFATPSCFVMAGEAPLPAGVYTESFDFGPLLATSLANPANLDVVDPLTWFGGGIVLEYEAADTSSGYSDLGPLLGSSATGQGVLVDVASNDTAVGGASASVIRLSGWAESFEAQIAVQNGSFPDVTPYGEGTGVTVDLFRGDVFVGSTADVLNAGIIGFETVSFQDEPFDTIVFRTSVETPGAAENGLDTFVVDSIRIVSCPGAEGGGCRADLDGDGVVGFSDLTQLLGGWGSCPSCVPDLDCDGSVGFSDLTQLLGGWGPC